MVNRLESAVMKLLSHNHLLCLNKDCKSNDALIIEATKVIQLENEPKLAFIAHILSTIDYQTLRVAAAAVECEINSKNGV